MHTVHMSLERHHFQILAALASHGRLGDAARSLHLSGSAATHRIQEAERRLGVALTERDGRTIRLTEAGQLLAEAGRDIEREIGRVELTARWMGTGAGRRIRIGVGFYDTASWLIDTFAPAEGVPRTELLRFHDDDLLRAVRDGEADVVVAPWPTLPSGLQHELLHDDNLVAAVPESSPLAALSAVTAADLAPHQYLTSGLVPKAGFEHDRFFLPAEVTSTSVIQVQSLEMLLRLVGEGLGVTIQPSLAVTWNRPHLDVTLVPLAGEPITIAWSASYRADADDDVIAAAERVRRAFVDAARRGEGLTRN